MQQIVSQYLHAKCSTTLPSVRSASTKQRSDADSRRKPVSRILSRTPSDRRDVQRRSMILGSRSCSSDVNSFDLPVTPVHRPSTDLPLLSEDPVTLHDVEKLSSTTCAQILTSRRITASLHPPRRATRQHACSHWALATKSAR
jgi:hypothetical protein